MGVRELTMMKGSGDLERRYSLEHLRNWLRAARATMATTAIGDPRFEGARYEVNSLAAAIGRAEASEAAA